MIEIDRKHLDIVLTCDPAISEREGASRTAVTVAGMTPYKKIFLLDYWVGRQGDPYRVIETILRLAEKWQPRCIGIESVAYQQALEPFTRREMQARNVWHSIVMLKPDRHEKKEQRILSLQPFFRSGQIYIQRGMLDFIEEYETFPLGKTRDLLDAFAYAVRLLAPLQNTDHHKDSLEETLRVLEKRDPSSARFWRSDAVRRGKLDPEEHFDDIIEVEEWREEDVVQGSVW